MVKEVENAPDMDLQSVPRNAMNRQAVWRRTSTLLLACALMAAVLLFSQEFLTSFPIPKLFAIASLTGLAIAAAFFSRVLPTGPRPPFMIPLLAVVAWAGLGLVRTDSPEAFSLVFLPVAGSAAAAWLAGALSAWPAEKSRLIVAFVLAHLGCGIYATAQYYGIDPWTWTLDYGNGRVFATMGNPNFLAGQMVLAIPFLAAAGIQASGAMRWLSRVALVFSLLALTYAQTRSAWVGLITGGLIIATAGAMKRRTLRLPFKPLRWLLGTLLVIGVIYSLPTAILNPTGISLPRQFASITDLEQQSARQRFFWWRAALELFRDAPLVGHGTGNFAREFPLRARRVAGPYSDLYPAFCNHPHNDQLFILSEHGILGFGLLVWLMVVWIRTMLRATSAGSILHLGALTSLIAITVHALWNMPSVIHSTIYAAGCLLGLTGSLPTGGGASAPDSTNTPELTQCRTRAVLAIGLALALAVSYRPVMLLAGEMYLNGARILKEGKRYGPAAFLARKALKTTKAPWRASFLLGGIMYSQHLYGEALKFFAIDEIENPWGADAILHQAKTLRELGRYAEADAECRRSLRLVPNYPEAAATIASLAYFRAKEARDARRAGEMRAHLSHARVWLNYALRFFPRTAEALKLLGFVEVMDSNWDAAADAWTRYAEVRPRDDTMRSRLGALRRELPQLKRSGRTK